MLNTSSCIYWTFVHLPLRILCLIHVPISSLGCWFYGGWVFWVPYKFWILLPYWMSSWQRFPPFLCAVSWIWWMFPLLCRSSSVWCRLICSFFLLEPFEFSLGSHFLYLFVPVYFLLLPGLLSNFRPYIKIFGPLWVDFCTGWKTGI
jgi:hypothetical protein